MRTLLWVLLVSQILSVLIRAIFIPTKDYPRTVTYKRGEDMIYLFISLGMGLWIAYLMFVV
jgi:hypothetical protein